MITQEIKKLSPQKYLDIERKSEFKSEYYNGEMFALAGASLNHNRICGNIHVSLANQFRDKNCEVFQSDLRIKVQESGLFTYPDIVIICGEPEFYDEQRDTVTNPEVIMEVLSISTEGYDRGLKFELYRRLNTLKDYLLISQGKIAIEYYSKNPDNSWTLKEYNNLSQQICIQSINCNLDLKEVYSKVEFEKEIRLKNNL